MEEYKIWGAGNRTRLIWGAGNRTRLFKFDDSDGRWFS